MRSSRELVWIEKKSSLRTELWRIPIHTGQRDKGEAAKNEHKQRVRKKKKRKRGCPRSQAKKVFQAGVIMSSTL